MQLYNHQKRILELNPAKSLLCWDTGTGKSLAAIALANKNSRQVLVIVPKALKEKWGRDLEIHGNKHTYWILRTKEEFKRDWKSLPAADIIVDEAHYFSGMKSQMYKDMLSYIKKHKPTHIWLLTATPYLSTPWNIYALAKILGHVWSYGMFDQKYFDRKLIFNRWIPSIKKGIEKEMAKLVQKIGNVVKLEDCVDVPDQVFEIEYFKETPKQTKRKEEIEELESNPIVKYTKLHEIENGILKGDEFVPDEFIDSDKMERIIELCKTNKKVAIICRYSLQIQNVFRNLKNELTKKIYIIEGAVKDRDAVVRAVDAAEEAVVIIQAQCSEGYELPSIGVILFASLSNSFKDYKQMLGRFLRINKLKKNVFIHLITKGDVDEAWHGSIMRKEDFDIEIYARRRDGRMSE